jgi:chromosomal replication initiator protein
MSAPSISSGPDDAAALWDRVLDRARQQLPESSVLMWFQGVRPIRLENGRLDLMTSSEYIRERLARHHRELIEAAASEARGERIEVHIETDPERPEPAAQDAPLPADGGVHGSHRDPPALATSATSGRGGFADGFTFDTFVTGPSNRFAFAAAMAVAEAPPGRVYNPLFIYGGVGLGKTHLLYAIANHMVQLSPRLRAKYVTSETFMAEFIQAVRERQGYQFAARYRDTDVLLVDDIQFLGRREETQTETEFFHTFNALHSKGGQIVITSDQPPQELSGFQERLRSRFRVGLCVDVLPPDLETRVAILQLKAARDRIEVPQEVLDYIASKFDQNIRELEGALLRVAALGSFTGQPVDVEMAERALADLLRLSAGEIPPEMIMHETAKYFGLTRDHLVGKSRSRPLTTARHIAMYLLREQNGMSLLKIGERFDRDHTTVMHGIRKVEELMRAKGSTYIQVQELTRTIRGRPRDTPQGNR